MCLKKTEAQEFGCCDLTSQILSAVVFLRPSYCKQYDAGNHNTFLYQLTTKCRMQWRKEHSGEVNNPSVSYSLSRCLHFNQEQRVFLLQLLFVFLRPSRQLLEVSLPRLSPFIIHNYPTTRSYAADRRLCTNQTTLRASNWKSNTTYSDCKLLGGYTLYPCAGHGGIVG